LTPEAHAVYITRSSHGASAGTGNGGRGGFFGLRTAICRTLAIQAPCRSGRSGSHEGEQAPMPDLLREYLPILIFIGLAFGLALVIVIASLIAGPNRPDPEKTSAYECGFEAFDDARSKFDVRFYLVSILFIIFDLEVAFLFPWAVSLGKIGMFGFWSMMLFLGVLTVGFIYEWKKGALEWE
jgi:NADH-quinone oxidoreductase subunit A